MDNFNNLIQKHFHISLLFFAIGLFFGLVYSINLLGYSVNSFTLIPENMRAIHISLMLYGFIPLMLSYLPFLLISKEVGSSQEGLYFLNLYFIFWYIFLVFMIISLLFGNTRGLAFYDFPYELNFILALAGVFYILALLKFVKLYKVLPLWIKISIGVVILAPFTLLILMNPIIGEVEKTISGPHGDNTLGMSFAIIPIYYLIIKYLCKDTFQARWHTFWIVPFVFYILSVLYKVFVAPLTYNEEWFLQYLTLLYIPLLYRWYSDANISGFSKYALLISIFAFLFVDVEGNIFFIPQIRWLIHRNDLVVAHAHVAVGIGLFFMPISMFANRIKTLNDSSFYKIYLFGILGIFIVLSISGLYQANIGNFATPYLWIFRTIFGLVVIFSLSKFITLKKNFTALQIYNLIGFLNDGIGAIILILLASYTYPLLGFYFDGKYEYVVFAFVSMTGLIHFFALKYSQYEVILTNITIFIRIFISAIFFTLYLSKLLGFEALFIGLFDFIYASIYLILQRKRLCQE